MIKETDLNDLIAKTNILTDEILDSINELTTYKSMGSLNWAVRLLKSLKDRISVGQKIIYETSGEGLTIETFRDLVEDRFSTYVLKATFKDTNLKNKVFFNIENTEPGLDLIYTGSDKNKLFRWIADIDDEYSLMELIPTKVVYIRHSQTRQIIPFLSEKNSCYIYDDLDGKIKEVGL